MKQKIWIKRYHDTRQKLIGAAFALQELQERNLALQTDLQEAALKLEIAEAKLAVAPLVDAVGKEGVP